jgi:hypothetical protein
MQYLVYRQEGNLGPYSLDELRAQVAAGVVQPADLAWHDGLAQWEPVANFLSAAAPASPPFAAPAAVSAEAVRQKYLSHESNLRSLSLLYYLTGALELLSGLAIGGVAIAESKTEDVVTGVVLIAIGVFLVWLGMLYRKLSRSLLVPATIAAGIGLLGFPLGTALSAYILYLLYSREGKFVRSGEYREIVAATPQIAWKTSLLIKILLGLLALAFVSVVVISVLIALGQQVPQH